MKSNGAILYTDAPLILHVQAGPGMTMISEANKMRRLFHFENNFTVAYWDQRACGKSFDKHIDPSTINFAQLAEDLITCTKHLLLYADMIRDKYPEKESVC